jgi:hypothetical protein
MNLLDYSHDFHVEKLLLKKQRDPEGILKVKQASGEKEKLEFITMPLQIFNIIEIYS